MMACVYHKITKNDLLKWKIHVHVLQFFFRKLATCQKIPKSNDYKGCNFRRIL